MRVEATRDDGAQLVTIDTSNGAAIVLPSGQIGYLSRDSAYARGGWEPAAGTELAIPAGVDENAIRAAEPAPVLPAGPGR